MGAREGMTLGPAYRNFRCRLMRWLAVLVILITWGAGLRAQDTSGQASPAPAAAKPAAEPPATQQENPATEPKAEVSTKDTQTTFKLHVNLVQVKVVVRDGKGNLVEGLKREDFLVYDQGKLQAVSTFGVETAETR